MNTVTYSKDAVRDFLVENFIPVRSQCDFTHFIAMMKRYQVKCTPTFVIRDPDGREHHRLVRFLPPEDFMAQLQVGKAKMYYDQDRLDKAALEFQVVIDRFPKTAAAEAAAFLLGVSHYKRSHQAGELRKTWERLFRDYPQSEWTRKARVYSTLWSSSQLGWSRGFRGRLTKEKKRKTELLRDRMAHNRKSSRPQEEEV